MEIWRDGGMEVWRYGGTGLLEVWEVVWKYAGPHPWDVLTCVGMDV
jgi:hypothetical protein